MVHPPPPWSSDNAQRPPARTDQHPRPRRRQNGPRRASAPRSSEQMGRACKTTASLANVLGRHCRPGPRRTHPLQPAPKAPAPPHPQPRVLNLQGRKPIVPRAGLRPQARRRRPTQRRRGHAWQACTPFKQQRTTPAKQASPSDERWTYESFACSKRLSDGFPATITQNRQTRRQCWKTWMASSDNAAGA